MSLAFQHSKWFKHTLAPEGMIGEGDLELFMVVDSTDEVLETVFRFYETRGFEPTEEKRKARLNL